MFALVSRSAAVLFLCCIGGVQAQAPAGKTIEGFWQDTERRILFSREAPPGYDYGRWTAIDQAQTYPSAKHIRRAGSLLEVLDLNYDENYEITTLAGTADRVSFTRKVKWTGCVMRHDCRLEGEAMLCAPENVCPQAGGEVVDWRGEERYARRAGCERDGRVQLQGFPVKCR